MACDCSSHGLNIMVRTIIAIVARDIGSDSLVAKLRNGENQSCKFSGLPVQKRDATFHSHGHSAKGLKR